MSDHASLTSDTHTYKITDLVGSSTKSIEDAVAVAVQQAGATLHNMRWVEVAEIRGHLEGDRVAHWQVGLRIGFTLDPR
ncbi:MAG: dodecin family protein [Gammaproteobacteria bacterium]